MDRLSTVGMATPDAEVFYWFRSLKHCFLVKQDEGKYFKGVSALNKNLNLNQFLNYVLVLQSSVTFLTALKCADFFFFSKSSQRNKQTKQHQKLAAWPTITFLTDNNCTWV